ncbi:unnamed protein product [Closterium sp. NIES-53]
MRTALWLPARRPFACPPCCLHHPALARFADGHPSCAPPCPACGHPIQFDTWLDDLQLYLLSDSRDNVSLFDHTSGASLAPPTTADSHLILPYLFPELSAFATVEDLVTQLRTSNPCYRAALPAEFLHANPPPTPPPPRSPSCSRSVVAVGATLGTPRTPFFEGRPPSPLAPSYASTAALDVLGAEDVGAASASGKRCSSKGKGGRSRRGGSGSVSGGGIGGGGGSGGGGSGGSGGGNGGVGGGGSGSGGCGGSGGSGSGGSQAGVTQRGGSGGGQRQQQQQRRSETPLPQQLREWFAQHGASGGSASCPYVIRTEAAALGASESALPSTAPAAALHTFTLDSGASRRFFRDSTNLTPLLAPVPVRLADPSGGPVLARSSTILPCPAVPSGSKSGLHLPSFFTNLVSTTALQDAMVTTPTPGGLRVSICTCTRIGLHLAVFTHRPGSSLYTLTTEPPQVAVSAQVSASGPVAPPCSFRLLSHQTLLWHHCLGHPSLPRLRGMHSRLLCASPHSSFPPTTAPLHTLHMDVWGPARVSGQGREWYFLLVVDDYTRYTTVFPLRSKGEVVDVLIPWIRTVRLQLRERFGQDLPVLRLHSDRGGEFSSDLLRDFCHGEGILQPFTLPASPQQNGIAERRIGLVMEGSRAFVRDTSPNKLSARAIPCVFLGFPLDARGWQFYHPTSRNVLPSHDVTFDESVPFYRLFPYRTAPLPPAPLFLAPGPPPVDPLPPQGPTPSGVFQVDPLPDTVPVEVNVASGAARGAASWGAEPARAELGGAETAGAEPGGAEPEGAEPGGAESEGAESGGAEPRGTASSGGPAGASPRLSPRPEPLSPEQVLPAGAGGPGGAGAAGPGGARTRGTRAAGAGGAGGAGAGDLGASGAGAGGPRAVDPRAGGAGAGGAASGGTSAGGTVQRRPFFVPPPPPSLPPLDSLQPDSPLPAPSPYAEQTSSFTEHREPASRPASPVRAVRTGRRVPRPHPPPVPVTHVMALRPSSVPLRVPLPPPPESSLPAIPDPESDLARAATPVVSRLIATVVTDLSFESTAVSALVAEVVDFAAACRLDYATGLVAESESDSPPSVGGECALGTDILEDRQEDFECLAAAVPHLVAMLLAPEGDPDAPDIPTPRSYAEAITGPYSSQWETAMDAEMASWKSTGSYVNAVPPYGANIVDGMWIFRGVDFFHNFSFTPKMTTLWVLLHVASQHDYELHSLDFSTNFLQGYLHEEIWLRRPHGFTGSFPASTQWSLRRPVYGPCQVPLEWHDTLRTTLAPLGFAPSTADQSLFLRTDTLLPPFYVLVYVDNLVFTTADTGALALVLQHFGFRYSSPQSTPLPTGHLLSAPPSDESLNLWPRVSLPETSPTLRWTGKVGDASVLQVWGSRVFVRDTSTEKFSSRAVLCVFLGFPPDVHGWQFYQPPRAVSSPLKTSHPLPGTVPVEVAVDSGVVRGAVSGGAERASAKHGGAESAGAEHGGAESKGVKSGGAELGGAEPGVTELESAEPGGAESEGTESGGAEPWATSLGGAGVSAGAGGTGGVGAAGPRDTGAAGSCGVGGAGAGGAGARDPGAGGAGAGGICARGAGAGGKELETLELEVLALGVLRLAVLVLEALCSGDRYSFRCHRRLFRHLTRSFARFLLQPDSPLPAQETDSSTERRELESRPALPVCAIHTGRRVPRSRPPPVPGTHIMALRPSSVTLRVPMPPPPESSLPAVSDPASDLARAANPTVPRLLATVVTDPSFESTSPSALVAEVVDIAAACRLDYATSLVAESESDCLPSVGGECALDSAVLEDRQEDFESLAAAIPHLVAMLLAPEGDPDAPDIPTPRSYAQAITGPYSSQRQKAMDAEMASWKSTDTYVNTVPPSGANIVDGMWIFRVKRLPRSPPIFKACYVARGFSQRQGVDFFHNFSPTPKMTTLRVLLHYAAQHDYELHSPDFSTAFLQSSLHEEIWLRCPPGFTGSFPAGTQWSLRRPVYGLRQAPREWHDTLRTTLAALGFVPSTADPSQFLRTNTSLPPLYVLMYVDDLVFSTADTEALALVKSELQKRHTCIDLGELRSYLGLQITRDRARRTITLTLSHMVHQVLQRFGFRYSSPQSTIILARYVAPERHRPQHWDAAKRVLRYLCSTSGMGLVLGGQGPVVLTRHVDASWVDDLAMQRLSQGYTFSLDSGPVSWRSTRSSSELRWLTYLLTGLGERPRSSPVLYIDNKAMIALCQEHRLEHRTKHIALRYFLARELQQCGQLRLAYVATRANTADIFTKALQSGDHQRFCTVLGLVLTWPHLFTA